MTGFRGPPGFFVAQVYDSPLTNIETSGKVTGKSVGRTGALTGVRRKTENHHFQLRTCRKTQKIGQT